MAKTISTHNGSVANREHNIRNPRATDKQEHIDKSLKGRNEILHDEKPREAYRRIFGKALDEYNAKQSREERRIRDYFAHVEKDSKKHTVYEMIVQIGDRHDTGIDAPVERECLKEFYAGWKDRNPHLECIGAYLHADEADGTVHLHVDYVPVATGYARGMEIQTGLVKALEQQGFVKAGARTAQIQWEARENAALEDICRQHGIEIEHPMAKGEKRKHLDTEIYKAQKQLEEKKAQIDFLDEVASYIATDGQKTIKTEDMTIPAKKTILGKIEAPERVGTFVENMNADQVNALMQRVTAADRLEDTVERAQEHCSEMIAAATKEAADIKETATAERNKTVANADNIIMQRDSILSHARKWADDLKRTYQDLANKVKQLLGRKESLEAEVSKLEAQTKQLEPLRAEVQDLTRARDILTGAVENEINQSRFYEPTGGFGSHDYDEKWARLKRGELLALYKDGTIRTVTQNDRGGFDYKTLDDEQAGLCRIGWFTTEETVRVPRNILKELIAAKDESKPISRNLENMIEQQQTVDRAVNKIDRGRSR